MKRFIVALLPASSLLGVTTVSLHAAELEIVNTSTKSIFELYVAPVGGGKGKWGPDRLIAQKPDGIAPGRAHTVAALASGAYDLRLIDSEDRTCEIFALEIDKTHRLDLTEAKLDECAQESH